MPHSSFEYDMFRLKPVVLKVVDTALLEVGTGKYQMGTEHKGAFALIWKSHAIEEGEGRGIGAVPEGEKGRDIDKSLTSTVLKPNSTSYGPL